MGYHGGNAPAETHRRKRTGGNAPVRLRCAQRIRPAIRGSEAARAGRTARATVTCSSRHHSLEEQTLAPDVKMAPHG